MTRREFMGAAAAAAVLELCGDFYLYHFRAGWRAQARFSIMCACLI